MKDQEPYIPTTVHRVLVVKLIKKLLGFLAPTFHHGSKRRTLAFGLYEQVKEFERELLRCVPVRDLEVYSKSMWVNLQERELPRWLIDALYSTLTYDPRKRAKCSTVVKKKEKEEEKKTQSSSLASTCCILLNAEGLRVTYVTSPDRLYVADVEKNEAPRSSMYIKNDTGASQLVYSDQCTVINTAWLDAHPEATIVAEVNDGNIYTGIDKGTLLPVRTIDSSNSKSNRILITTEYRSSHRLFYDGEVTLRLVEPLSHAG